MKTTLDIPDPIFREAKARAALEGRRLKDIVTEGLRLRLEQAPPKRKIRLKFPLFKSNGKPPLVISDDIASRVELADDLSRYEASLR